MANPLPRQSQTQGTAAGTPSVIKDGTEDNSASLQDPATLRTVLVNTCTTYLVTTSNLQQYFTNTADSSGGPVERVVQLDWYTYVIYFYNHEDAVNVVCRDNHECGAVYLSVFLYDEQSRSVYTVSQDKNPRKRSVHAVDVPVVAREASATVLVTGLNPHIPNTALIREINKLLDKGRHPMPNTKRLHDTWMAFLQYQRHEDALRVVEIKQVTIPFQGVIRPDTANVHVFLFRGAIPHHADRPLVTQWPAGSQYVTEKQAIDHTTLTTLTTLLVCTPNLSEDDLAQYFRNGRVTRLAGLTYVVHFHSHEDAVNVVCRDNHQYKGRALSVFLYDEQSGSVYSGSHTVPSQDRQRKVSVHAMDVPLVDREASTTVLVTGIASRISDSGLKNAFDKLHHGRRTVQNLKRLQDTGIAFIQFQHHEDAVRIVKMQQVSVAGWLLERLSVNVFLYQGSVPGHTDRPHETEISTIDQHETDTAPGAPPTPEHDPQPRDVHCVSVELQPSDEHTAHGKADTPDEHTAHGKADTPDEHTAHGKADTPDEHTAHGKADTPDAHIVHSKADTPDAHIVHSKADTPDEHTAHGKADTPDAHIVHSKADTPDEHTAHGKADTPDEHTAHGKADTPDAHIVHSKADTPAIYVEEVEDQRTQAECGPQSHKVQLEAEIARLQTQMNAQIEAKLQSEVSRLETQFRTQLQQEVQRLESEKTQDQKKLRCEFRQLQSQMRSTASQSTSEVNQLRSDVSELKTLTTEITRSQTQLRSQMNQVARGITQLQNQTKREIEQLLTRLQSQQRNCEESSMNTRSSLEVQERMHARMMAEAQTAVAAQTRAEIVTLMGEIRTLGHEITEINMQLRNQTGQGPRPTEVLAQNFRQQDTDREETMSVITVVNASSSGSSGTTSHAPS